jgi:hypothetical protein
VIWVYISEIFPNRVRAKGQVARYFTHWFNGRGGGFSGFSRSRQPQSRSPGKSFLFFAVCMLAQALFVWQVSAGNQGASRLSNCRNDLGIE